MNLYNATTHEEVKLPAVLTDFRGDEHVVLGIFSDAEPGKSGKVSVSTGMIYYPGVFGCYIADEPRAERMSETVRQFLMDESGEVVATLADGWTLRSGVYDPEAPGALTSGEYVRICRPDGSEYVYYDFREWEDDPILVMGAIVNIAAGLRMVKEDA